MAFKKNFSKKAIKTYAKQGVKNLAKKAKSRYFTDGKVTLANAKVAQMAKDIDFLRKEVNAEKKRIDDQSGDPKPVAQTGTRSLSSGYWVNTEMFLVPEGTGHREKNGNSIKCNSYHLDFRIIQQTASDALRGKIYLIRIKEPQNITSQDDLVEKFLVPSAFDNKYDSMSPRNYENFRDFQIISQKNIYIPPDQVSGQQPRKEYKMGGNLNFHQRTKEVAGSRTAYDTNEIALIFVADKGDTASSNHFTIEWKGTMYFYDN